jgi:hypothetical protein
MFLIEFGVYMLLLRNMILCYCNIYFLKSITSTSGLYIIRPCSVECDLTEKCLELKNCFHIHPKSSLKQVAFMD